MKRYGSRAEVFHGTALMTQGRLKKEDLILNKHGRIVSKLKSQKHSKNKKTNPLLALGLQRDKGSGKLGFGPKKVENKKSKKSDNKSNNNKSNNNKSKKSKGFFNKILNSLST